MEISNLTKIFRDFWYLLRLIITNENLAMLLIIFGIILWVIGSIIAVFDVIDNYRNPAYYE